MRFHVCLCLLLFIATALAIQDNLTVVPVYLSSSPVANSTIHSISATTTPNLPSSATSFTINTYSFSSTFMPSHTVTPTVTPLPPQASGCYSVNTTKHTPCVLLCVKQPIKLISNLTDENGHKFNATVPIPGPNSVNVSGFCPKSINSNIDRSGLFLSWSVSSKYKYELNLTFVLNQKVNGGNLGGQDVWFLETANYNYKNSTLDVFNSVNLTNGPETGTIHSDVRRAYTCDKPQLIILKSEHNTHNGTETILNMTNYTLQPFALNLTGNGFKYLDTCEPGGIPLFVPIIVAGILAGFVLILMVLYVIGRFTTKKKVQYERLS